MLEKVLAGILLVFAIAMVEPLNAQFAYDRISYDLGFDFEKPVQFKGTPRYNRVEGLHLELGVELRPPQVENLLIYAYPGIGFWNDSDKKFTARAGLRKDLFEFQRLSIGAEYFRDIHSRDDWALKDFENSAAGFLFRQDGKDYFAAEGLKLYADHQFLDNHIGRLELTRTSYDSLRRNIDWSVFKGDFPENSRNPGTLIGIGDEISLRFILSLDWRDNPIFPLTGWLLEGIYERTLDDFDTDGIFLTVKRFQPAFGIHRLLLRGMLGTRTGSLALQHTLNLGGIGRLRGFEDREFSGNRLFLFNANYLFNGDILQRVPLQGIPFLGGVWSVLSLGAFLDTGWVGLTDVNNSFFEGFGELKPDNFKTDMGLSLLVLEGILRIDIAKRMDRSNDDFRVTFRLLENF